MEQILEILENNARASVEDIAKMTSKPIAEVKKKIKTLESKGVIAKYKAIINEQVIQGQAKVRALIEVKVSPQKGVGFDSVAEKLYKHPEVKSCYLLSGGNDLHLVVEGKDIHDIAAFVSEKLASLDHVQGTSTQFLLKKYKEDGVVLKKCTGKRLAITY